MTPAWQRWQRAAGRIPNAAQLRAEAAEREAREALERCALEHLRVTRDAWEALGDETRAARVALALFQLDPTITLPEHAAALAPVPAREFLVTLARKVPACAGTTPGPTPTPTPSTPGPTPTPVPRDPAMPAPPPTPEAPGIPWPVLVAAAWWALR